MQWNLIQCGIAHRVQTHTLQQLYSTVLKTDTCLFMNNSIQNFLLPFQMAILYRFLL
jgi:hypothetical protein